MAPPKLSASNSSSSLANHFPNLRQFFQRSASQPSQYHDASAHLSSSSTPSGAPSSPPRRASAAPSFSSSLASSSSSVDPDADARMHAFGSCTQVLATTITALFRAINTFGVYQPESAVSDNTTTRRAKLLYVQLLDKAQRERGEWRGFADTSSSSSSSSLPNREKANESALDILSTHLRDLSRNETFALLNELVDVSFRSIRGPLVSSEIYLKHKRPLAALSLDIPVSLHVLLEIRGILNQLGRDEKLCVFRLLTLWHAMAVANEAQDLRRTIQEKHHLVFSDCTELEFLTTRKDPRHDAVAIALLHILVLYHDVLFSDVEFLLIKQELQLSQSLRRPRVASGAEETDEPKTSVPSEDSTQTESSSSSPPQGEQTEIESERSDVQTKNDDAPDATKEQSSSRAGTETVETRAGAETVEADEPKVEGSGEGAAQVSAPPSSSPSLCAKHVGGQTEQGDTLDATTESPQPDEDDTTSSSLGQEELPPAAAAVQTLDAEPTQSEERSAGRDQETDIPNIVSAAAATENVSEERSPQLKPQEILPDASSQSVARVSPSALTRSHSTNPPHHHNHGSARGHSPAVSIRPHSLSPQKTRQSKRFQFESLTVSTATTITTATSEKEQKQYNHHNHSHHHSSSSSSSSKSNDARQATLLNDVVQIVDYFGASSKEPVAHKNGNSSIHRENPTAPVAIVRIQQHSPEAKESSSGWPTEQQSTPSAARAASTKSSNNHEPHAEAGGTEEGDSKAGDAESSTEPPVKRASIAQSSSKPSSPQLHEITDLANTYFSFSFAAATMRTMAIMAVYAIRRHQHNHHQQHE